MRDKSQRPNRYPDPLLEGYKFISCNHPSGNRRGGVGLFYREDFPLLVRDDLSFDECIVSEITLDRKKIFFTVLYRSPSIKANSPEFDLFLQHFQNLVSSIKNENPYAMFFTGDFNAHCQNWYLSGDTNSEGLLIDDLTSSLNLDQLVSVPTHFEENNNPSCIDLIFTDQPNIVMETGVLPSLDTFCKHQIIFCRLNLRIPPASPYEREIFHYDSADLHGIQNFINGFPWEQHFAGHDPSWQVEFFNETILNVMRNFIPNEKITVKPKDPPWITKDLKRLIKRQNRQYKNFVRNGCQPTEKHLVENFRNECFTATNNAKREYLEKMGRKLSDSKKAPKTYWKILNNLLNKTKSPRIPPLRVDDKLITNSAEKAALFNEYFSSQCKLNLNDSELLDFSCITDKRLKSICVTNEEIRSIILALNPNKSHGPDQISGRMIQLAGDSIIRPLNIIFSNILKSGSHHEPWKLAIVTPTHKELDKQVIKNYRPISLLPICAKTFERILFNTMF